MSRVCLTLWNVWLKIFRNVGWAFKQYSILDDLHYEMMTKKLTDWNRFQRYDTTFAWTMKFH